jgi:hypothetical protein
VGELCGCIEDRKEAHGDEMGALQGILKYQFYPIGYKDEQIMKCQYLQQEQG